MTQKETILKHLVNHGSITSWDAIMEYGITRLANYIFILRNEGYTIPSKSIKVTTRLGNRTTISEYYYKSTKVKQTAIQFNSEYVY